MSQNARQLRRLDSTDTIDSGSDDGTLVVRQVRRKSTVFEGQSAGFVPKGANQVSPVSRDESNSPLKTSIDVVSQLTGGKTQPPVTNNNDTKDSASSVTSNHLQQSSVASQIVKDVANPMEPIQLRKPGPISVPEIPSAQPRVMIYSLHSKTSESNQRQSTPPPSNQPQQPQSYEPVVPIAKTSSYDSSQKVVLPVRMSNSGASELHSMDHNDSNGHQNGHNTNPRQLHSQQSSRDGSRRGSYTTPAYSDYPNGATSADYRIDSFSNDGSDMVSPQSYGHSRTPPPSSYQQNSSQMTSPYYGNTDASVEYSSNPMQSPYHHSPPPPSSSHAQQYNPASQRVQRVGATNAAYPSPASSQISGYTTTSSSSSFTTGSNRPASSIVSMQANPMRPRSPTATKNDRLRSLVLSNMTESEQIRVALLISTQDEKYGTNMFDSLNTDDHVEVENMIQHGYKQEQALMTIFKRKFEPLGPGVSNVKSPSRRSSIGPTSAPGGGGYESESSSHFSAPMMGGHSRQPSYFDSRDLTTSAHGTPQAQRGREYIGYHPEDATAEYQQSVDEFDDVRSYTSYQLDNHSVRSGATPRQTDQRVGAQHHRATNGGMQSFVGHVDTYDPLAAGIDNMSINSGSLPPAAPPRRLHTAHSSSSVGRTSYPVSGQEGGGHGATSSGHLPRTRSIYDRSEFATYDQYNVHPPTPGQSSSRNLSRTITPESGFNEQQNYNSNNNSSSNVPYYMQDYQQHQHRNAGYDEYYADQQYQQPPQGYQSYNPSPKGGNGNGVFFTSGNNSVASSAAPTSSSDRRIAANNVSQYSTPPQSFYNR